MAALVLASWGVTRLLLHPFQGAGAGAGARAGAGAPKRERESGFRR